jgi:transposase
MYIDIVPNRNSPPAILLREAWREGKKTRKRTLANLSDWPPEKIDIFRRLLQDEPLVSPHDLFTTQKSLPHGHVEAVLQMMRKLELERLISSQPCRERDLVVAMIVQRLIDPVSKLATTRLWHSTTLAEELGVAEASEDDLYAAMDWLGERQERIEKKLAARHLRHGGLVLYDVSSSFYEGHTCGLAKFGHDRDGKKSLPIIVYGVMTNGEGCPVAVSVYAGNTADPTTVADQIDKLREQFGLERVVMVGDRGMLTQPQIDKVKLHPGLGWITALTSTAIRQLVEQEALQLSLLDEKNLAEITAPEYPGERLMVCHNPVLEEQRRRKRQALLQATEKSLEKIGKEVARRKKKPLTAAAIGVKVGKVLGRYRMGKHFACKIEEGSFVWSRRAESITEEENLDGIYVLRTSEPAERLSAEDTVRSYKSLAEVERAFRCLKGIDLLVRPIRHRTEERVPAHIFLCVLAYYVEWHLRRAWAPLLFEDEERWEQRQHRDPVRSAEPSASAQRKKSSHETVEGLPVHSLQTLMAELASRARVTYTFKPQKEGEKTKEKTNLTNATFKQVSEPTPVQARAYELIRMFPVTAN